MKIVRESLFEAETQNIPTVKIEDCDIVYAEDGTAIDVKKLMKDMERTKVYIVTQSPLFAPYVHEFVSIYTWLVPTMATDGIRLFVNPLFASKLEWNQKIFVVIHEIMHCILLHMIRGKGFDHELFNYAGDYEINTIIIDTIDDFNKDFITKLGGLYDEKYLNMPAELIYKELLKNSQPKGKGGSGGPGGSGEPGRSGGSGGSGGAPPPGGYGVWSPGSEANQRGHADHIMDQDPGGTGTIIPKDLGKKIAEKSGYAEDEMGQDINNEAKWEKNSRKMLKDAEDKKAGKGKGGALINILGGLHRGVVDWKAIFTRYVATALSPEKVQRIGNKKHMGEEILRYGERNKYDAIEKIVVCVDVSGSVNKEMLENMINEINGIIYSRKVKTITVLFFDDGVDEKSVQTLNKGTSPFLPKNVKGGGGTDFQKPLDWIKNKLQDKISLCVFLTDGQASNPVKPRYWNKFIWIIYNNFSFEEPFGKAIKIKL